MGNKPGKGQLFIAITGAVGLSLTSPILSHTQAFAVQTNETANLVSDREVKIPVDVRQALAEIDRLVQNRVVNALYVDSSESTKLLKLAHMGERPFPDGGGMRPEGGRTNRP